MKIYKVKRIERLIETAYVKATSKEEAIEIAQGSSMFDGNGDILDVTDTATIEQERPVGVIIHTKDGYEDADGKVHEF